MKPRIYKVKGNLNIDNITEKLEEKGFIKKGENKRNDEEAITMSFWLDEHIKSLPHWISELQNFFDVSSDDRTGEIPKQYNGMILVKTIKESIYLLPFGQGYNTAMSVADMNFGMNFAERTIEESGIFLKGVNYVQRNKMRSVVNYRESQNELPFATESFFSLSAKPINENIYGQSIDCGVGISLSKDFNLDSEYNTWKIKEFFKLFNQIDESLERNQVSNLPRLQRLRKSDPISEHLDRRLIEGFLTTDSNVDLRSIAIDINRIQLIDNEIQVINSKNEIGIYVKGHKSEMEKIDISTSGLKSYILDHITDVSSIDEINIIIPNEENYENPIANKCVKDFLYCEIEYNDTVYIIENGYWGYLNEAYMEKLNDRLNQLDSYVLYEDVYECEYTETTEISGEDAYIKAITNNVSGDMPSESPHKLHKRTINTNGLKIEVADIYDERTDELIAVKRGLDTSNAIYSFEQSTMAMRMLDDPKGFKLKEKLTSFNNESYTEHNIFDAELISKIIKCRNNSVLWLARESPQYFKAGVSNREFSLRDIHSILLKSRIVDWFNYAFENGYNPKLYFAVDKPV